MKLIDLKESAEPKIPEYVMKGDNTRWGEFILWNKNKKVLWIKKTRRNEKLGYDGKLMYSDTTGKTRTLALEHTPEDIADFEKAGIPTEFVDAFNKTDSFALLIDKTEFNMSVSDAEVKKQKAQLDSLIKGTTIKVELKNIFCAK